MQIGSMVDFYDIPPGHVFEIDNCGLDNSSWQFIKLKEQQKYVNANTWMLCSSWLGRGPDKEWRRECRYLGTLNQYLTAKMEREGEMLRGEL